MNKTYYFYYMLERPVSIGTQPDKFVSFTDEQGVTPSDRHHWGIVYYDRPLSDKEMNDYEMEYGGVADSFPCSMV
jgi:hypothetical protein|nr:MAG TPA: Defence against restriction A C-terminal [Bacteriophage sp.]